MGNAAVDSPKLALNTTDVQTRVTAAIARTGSYPAPVVEASVLSGLRTHLRHPDLVKEFVAEYHRELNRVNSARDLEEEARDAELARIERQIRSIIDAIKDGFRTPTMKEELLSLEARKAELSALQLRARPPAPRLHPNLAEVYRQKVARLQEELNR